MALVVNGYLVPVPLQMVSSLYYSFPYIVVLLAVFVVSVVLFIVFPTLRIYRKRRNILIYAAIAVVLVSLVAQIDNVSRRAIIDYAVGGPTKFYSGTLNQLTLSSGNHGNRDARFTLVISSVNASFQIQPQQNSIQTDNKTAKVQFYLQESWFPKSSDNKPLFFTIDDNVTGFSFSVSFDSHGSVDVASGVTSLSYVWNGTENCYNAGVFGGFVV
jgi:hypothetical protein